MTIFDIAMISLPATGLLIVLYWSFFKSFLSPKKYGKKDNRGQRTYNKPVKDVHPVT